MASTEFNHLDLGCLLASSVAGKQKVALRSIAQEKLESNYGFARLIKLHMAGPHGQKGTFTWHLYLLT